MWWGGVGRGAVGWDGVGWGWVGWKGGMKVVVCVGERLCKSFWHTLNQSLLLWLHSALGQPSERRRLSFSPLRFRHPGTVFGHA